MKKQIVLLAITLLLCLQGCGFFYIPSFGGKIKTQGFSISRSEIDNFLEIGKTSMGEIQSTWGYPSSLIENRNIWVYIGTKTVGYGGMFDFISPFAPMGEAGAVKRYVLLLIKFDKDDCLKRYELKKMPKNFVINDDIKQQAIEWDNSSKTPSQ
jgi:hypothetical protein